MPPQLIGYLRAFPLSLFLLCAVLLASPETLGSERPNLTADGVDISEGQDTSLPAQSPPRKANSSIDGRLGLVGLLSFYFCLWLLLPFSRLAAIRKAKQLATTNFKYRIENDATVNNGFASFKHLMSWNFGPVGRLRKPMFLTLFLRFFLTLNPGVFIFLGAGAHPIACAVIVAICVAISVPVYRATTRRYWSIENYEAYLNETRKRFESLVAMGVMEEVSPGNFERIPARDVQITTTTRTTSFGGSTSTSSKSSSRSGSGSGQ